MRGAGETFRAGEFDGGHAQTLDVARMPDGAHRDAVVDLENLLPLAAHGEEQDAIAIRECGDRAAAGELVFDILAPVRDGFDPTIGLFDHEVWLVGWRITRASP